MDKYLGAAETPLSEAEAAGWSAEIALHIPKSSISLSVAQVRDGIRRVREVYASRGPLPEAKLIGEELARLQTREQTVLKLRQLYRDIEQHRTQMRSSQQKVDKIVSSENPSAREEQDRWNLRRGTLVEELADLGGRRAVVVHKLALLDGESIEEINERLNQLETDLAVPRDGVAAALELAQAEEDTARGTAERWKGDAERLKQEQATLMTAARNIARTLLTSDDHRWLRKAIGPTDHLTDDAPAEQYLAVIERAHRYAVAIGERFGGYRNRLLAVSGAIDALATRLRGGPEPSPLQLNVHHTEVWLNQIFSDWFNHDRVREELLETSGRVSVDIRQREVRWTDGQTELSRPLEAFSSGQQAFAYTRARLARLDRAPRQVPYRLIVLDEFGAFIALNRLSTLYEHLQERVERDGNDQFLVILPLSRDYDAEAESATEPRRSRLAQHAQDVLTQQYTIREL
jgi:hypothetical protein